MRIKIYVGFEKVLIGVKFTPELRGNLTSLTKVDTRFIKVYKRLNGLNEGDKKEWHLHYSR